MKRPLIVIVWYCLCLWMRKKKTFMTRPATPGIAWNVVSMLSTSFNPFLSGIPQGSVEAPSSTDSPYANDRVHVTWECQKMSKGHIDRSSLLFYCHLQSLDICRLITAKLIVLTVHFPIASCQSGEHELRIGRTVWPKSTEAIAAIESEWAWMTMNDHEW